MKTLYSLLILAFASVSLSVAYAAEPQTDAQAAKEVADNWSLVSSGTYWDCDNFVCPVSNQTTVLACFEVPDCPNVTDAEIRAAVNRVLTQFCEEFKRCCEANGCDSGDCVLVTYDHFCASQIRLCVEVTIRYKCG